jgi:hypothetical protein
VNLAGRLVIDPRSVRPPREGGQADLGAINGTPADEG